MISKVQTLTVAATGSLIFAGTSTAAFTGLTTSVTPVSQDGWVAPDPRTLWKVSVYAGFDATDDRLIAVYGDAVDTLTVTTSDDDGFWQFNANGAQPYSTCDTSMGINPALDAAFPSQVSDSFVTIGFVADEEDGQLNQMNNIGVDFTSFNSNAVDATISVDNGSWFCTPDDYQTLAGNFTANRVLIGQFTVAGGETVSGSVNIQWNDGSSVSTKSTALAFSATAESSGTVSYDLDGTGTSDIVWQLNTEIGIFGWFMDGATKTVGWIAQNADMSTYTLLGSGDVDGDGNADLVWQGNNGIGIFAWLMDGTSKTVQQIAQNADMSAYNFLGFGDLDGNGTDDFIWQRTNEVGVLGWYMNPGGASKTVGWIAKNADMSAYTLVGVGDCDGAGTDDLVWQLNTEIGMFAWFMNGMSKTVGWIAQNADMSAYTVRGVADVDGSGTADIVLQKDNGIGVLAWLIDTGGAGKTTGWIAQNADMSSYNLIGLGDLDGNGAYDLVFQRNTHIGVLGWYMVGGGILGKTTGWVAKNADMSAYIVHF